MDSLFKIDGRFLDNKNIELVSEKLFINIPEWIEERNVYSTDTIEQIGTIKPKKYGGLTYRIIDFKYDFARIKTSTYGECYVMITEATKITNYPVYERGEY